MNKEKHLLSDSAEWMTNCEFVDKEGNIIKAIGEAKIVIEGTEIINDNWTCIDGKRLCSCYKIERESDFKYHYECKNSTLGNQTGDFCIDRNVLFSKFTVKETNLSGFEVFVKEDDECIVYGTLYDGAELINSWRSIMVKML
jgi:hypothetical protein